MQGMMTLTKKDLIEFVNEKFADKRDDDRGQQNEFDTKALTLDYIIENFLLH